MALIKTEHFVNGRGGSLLERDHGARAGRQLLIVGGVLQLPVPLVACALARVLAAVEAGAEALAFSLVEILFDVSVYD